MILGLQMLRGVAALLVVFAHIAPQIEHLNGPVPAWLNDGHYGVDIFFVISGFIIWTSSQAESVTPARFILRRIIRVVPLYWIATGLVTAVALVAPALLASTRFSLPHAVASFLFIPARHPVLNDIFPILVPGWTLNCEAAFYVIFAIGLVFRQRLLTYAWTFAVLVGVVLVGAAITPTSAPLILYTKPIMLEFAMGLLVGLLYTHAAPPPRAAALAAAALGAVTCIATVAAGIADTFTSAAGVGVPAAVAIWGVTAAKRNGRDIRLPLLAGLGNASYSLYLTHVLVLPVGSKLWAKAGLGLGDPNIAFFIMAEVLLAVVAGYAVHRAVERPLLRVLRDRFESKDRTRGQRFNAAVSAPAA